MKLKWLKLEHFRNYENLELNLDSPVTALVGLNAQGKTNFLESIAFLALGKSFRAGRAIDTLKWDRPHGRIRAMVERNGKETELEVFMQRDPESKKIKKHSKLTKPKSFFGTLRVVLFTPDQLELISGSPLCRRQFLDRLLIQVDRDYVEALTNFQKILNHRNALLKSIQMRRAQEWELDVWDTRLISEAICLWQKRKIFLDFLQENLQKSYREIAGSEENLTLNYHSHQDNFEERLLSHRSHDVQNGSTSIGPHRDDFTLFLDGQDLAESGSRGEQRSAVLVLKMIELDYIEKQTGEKPILLLDDVFSELDSSRQAKLSHVLENYQCVLTTTSLDHVKNLKKAKIYQVEDGNFKPEDIRP